jgi:predicted HicB family RNase H-like nuclease
MEKRNQNKMSVLIDKELHNKYKIYCAIHRHSMVGMIEKMIEEKMNHSEN